MAFNIVQTLAKANIFGHFWGKLPHDVDGGVRPKGLPVPIAFDGTTDPLMIDLTLLIEEGAIETLQSIWIDNYGGANYIEATVQSTGQRFRIAPASAAYIPLPFPQGRLYLTRTDAGDASVIFYNVPIPPQAYAQGGGGVAANVAISSPLGAGLQAAAVRVTVASDQPPIDVDIGPGPFSIAGAVTIADGANVAQGTTTDAAITNPATNGTVIAYLRGMLTNWVTFLSRLPAALGQGTMAQSLRVVLASDQSSIPVAASIANGADVTQGAIADAAVTNPASAGSLVALLKGLLTRINFNLTPNSASNISATTQAGALIVARPGSWTVRASASGSAASASKAAGGAGVRHVLTAFGAFFNDSAGGNVGTLVIRDGAAGVGTIIWQITLPCVTHLTAPPQGMLLPDIIGSANTAATIEFTGSTGTTLQQVNLAGYSTI